MMEGLIVVVFFIIPMFVKIKALHLIHNIQQQIFFLGLWKCLCNVLYGSLFVCSSWANRQFANIIILSFLFKIKVSKLKLEIITNSNSWPTQAVRKSLCLE